MHTFKRTYVSIVSIRIVLHFPKFYISLAVFRRLRLRVFRTEGDLYSLDAWKISGEYKWININNGFSIQRTKNCFKRDTNMLRNRVIECHLAFVIKLQKRDMCFQNLTGQCITIISQVVKRYTCTQKSFPHFYVYIFNKIYNSLVNFV